MSARETLRCNDRRFLSVAAALRTEEWRARSLCSEWSNHEVLAHLVVGYSGALDTFAAEIGRRRGSYHSANTSLAAALAASHGSEELLDDFAALIERPRGIGRSLPRRMPLGDHVTTKSTY